MPQIGPLEILVIFIVALVVFGPSKLPEIGRQVGRGLREFRKFQASLRDDIEDAFREDDEEPEEAHIEANESKPLEAGTAEPGPLEAGTAEPGPPEAGKRQPGTSDPPKPDSGKPIEPPPADATA